MIRPASHFRFASRMVAVFTAFLVATGTSGQDAISQVELYAGDHGARDERSHHVSENALQQNSELLTMLAASVCGWSDLGAETEMELGVAALANFNDGTGLVLYAGGNTGVAKWDGSSWSALDSGAGGTIALAVFDDGGGPALYAGGQFTQAGGGSANRIAKWDGTQWSPLGSGVTGGIFPTVDSLAVFDDGDGPALFVGGGFTTAGGNSANRIAKWNGTEWSALGTGMNPGQSQGYVTALAVFDDGGGPALYAGGNFDTAGGVNVNNIAKWDGTEWSAVGTGMDHDVFALAVFDDGTGPALYAGGSFDTAGGVSANHIARWDGSEWSALGTGLSGGSFPIVLALTVFDDGNGPALYAGGEFTIAGGNSANGVAKWDGTEWSALGTGIDHKIQALAHQSGGGGPALFAGWIAEGGGASAIRVAKWTCPGKLLKNRFLSIIPPSAPGVDQTIQVCIATMPQFPARVGECWWAGPEVTIPNAPNPTLAGALLECTATPHAQEWLPDPLHLYGAAIVPQSTYEVRMCDEFGSNCSDPVQVNTGKWGDVVPVFDAGQPDFADISALVAKFGSSVGSVDLPRADLVGNTQPDGSNIPNLDINFPDISQAVQALSGASYPATIPACP